MNIRKTMAVTVIAMCALGVSAANASVVFSDNFDQDVAQTNWSGDSIFISIPQPGNIGGLPSVDLVGPGYFDNLANHPGNSVDLDGSTGNGNDPSGEIQSVTSLGLGTYTVSFTLAGNNRGVASETTRVSIGNVFYDITPTNTDGYLPYSFTFANVSGNVDFKDLAFSNQQGNLLDDVVVSSVPEPATWAMFLLGFGAVGFAMRGSRRKGAAVTA